MPPAPEMPRNRAVSGRPAGPRTPVAPPFGRPGLRRPGGGRADSVAFHGTGPWPESRRAPGRRGAVGTSGAESPEVRPAPGGHGLPPRTGNRDGFGGRRGQRRAGPSPLPASSGGGGGGRRSAAGQGRRLGGLRKGGRERPAGVRNGGPEGGGGRGGGVAWNRSPAGPPPPGGPPLENISSIPGSVLRSSHLCVTRGLPVSPLKQCVG